MAKEVIMPKFGMTQTEATIVEWLVQEGDRVERDEPIAEVTTDKVNMEVPSPSDGIIGGIRYDEGDTVQVTQIIAFILGEGESVPEIDLESKPEAVREAEGMEPEAFDRPRWTPLARRIAESEGIDPSQLRPRDGDQIVTRDMVMDFLASAGRGAQPSPTGKVRATPAARRIAREKSMALGGISGTGPQGRIQAVDVRSEIVSPGTGPTPLTEETVLPLQGLRKTIAERMQRSAREAPHIHLSVDVDMSNAVRLRQAINERLEQDKPRVSMTAILIKLLAWALRQHPHLNAHFASDGTHLLPQVNIGMAVAIDDGLIVPVVRDADEKGFLEIARDVRDLSQRAREGSLLPDDVAGGTFTLSNLGMYGIDGFTAIINPPQVAILAVGRTMRKFVPDEHDQPIVRPLMNATLAVDHRALDGAQAAQFLQTVVLALEEPTTLLL